MVELRKWNAETNNEFYFFQSIQSTAVKLFYLMYFLRQYFILFLIKVTTSLPHFAVISSNLEL